ncbi:MAG: hypothetical protein IT258_04810 [Saprospiraceae bacterium]|nr:hypothetical protein [Saprospiraceae bacterium]
MGKVVINEKIISKEGCVFNIVGTVEYSLFPPSFDGFAGTVTGSGNPPCPNGTWSFGLMVSSNEGGTIEESAFDIVIVVNDNNIYRVNDVGWRKGRKEVPKFLNASTVDEILLNEFRRLEDSMKKEIAELTSHNNLNKDKIKVTVEVEYGK